MNELPKKISYWTPTAIASMVLLLTYILLQLRISLRTSPGTLTGDLFLETLLMFGLLMPGLRYLDKNENENRIMRILMLVLIITGYLVLIKTYLLAS